MTNPNNVLIDHHPGRSAQTIGLAVEIGTDPTLIHEPSVGVVGTKGDSQCYLGVMAKVEAIHLALKGRIGRGPGQLKLRLVQPEYTIATSDGIRNGTPEMRYSLIGREVTQDALSEHLGATGLAGTIAVVACDKPPVGVLAALLEHNRPGIIMSDGPIHPGTDPKTGEKLDIVSAFQVAGNPDPEYRHHIACHACPGYGSCGGMFTYNTMQTFIGVLGLQPLHMVAPPSDDPRRLTEFPAELVTLLAQMIDTDLKPRDIVVRDSIRNATIVAMAIGGSTNAIIHLIALARRAGVPLSLDDFDRVSRTVPVIANLEKPEAV
jgi:dihydroxy-acid dehydratase